MRGGNEVDNKKEELARKGAEPQRKAKALFRQLQNDSLNTLFFAGALRLGVFACALLFTFGF